MFNYVDNYRRHDRPNHHTNENQARANFDNASRRPSTPRTILLDHTELGTMRAERLYCPCRSPEFKGDSYSRVRFLELRDNF
jgi:hypothetical protein